MTCGCQLPQERVFQDIHFNRYHNTMMINKLREDMIERFSCQAPWTKLSTGCYMYVSIVNNNLAIGSCQNCRFHETKMTQGEARKVCEGDQAHLVEINTQEENEAIKAEIDRRGFKARKIEIWLGITDRQSEGDWVLESNGERIPFSDWDKSEPNDKGQRGEDCAHLNKVNKWNDCHCDGPQNGYRYTALCEI